MSTSKTPPTPPAPAKASKTPPAPPPDTQVTCTRSIMFRQPATMVDPSQQAAAKPSKDTTPYVKPAQSFTIPVSAGPVAIPAWVTELPEYQQAVDAGVLTEFQPKASTKAAAAPEDDEEEEPPQHPAGTHPPAGGKTK